jgi:hypothetical protein
MARRYQIIKKTTEGVFRAAVMTRESVDELIHRAQQDPECKYVVVKDRHTGKRLLVWRKNHEEVLDFWVLWDTEPEIVFKTPKKVDKDPD